MMLRGILQLITKNTADFLVFINIYVTVGFKTHLIMMSSNYYKFVIRNSCFLQLTNSCFSNTVICDFLLVISNLVNLAIFFM